MKRGRKSTAELATVVVDAGRTMPAAPPAELTDAQATVWRAAVASMPGTWLSQGSWPILVAFCRHVCRARLLESMVAGFEAEWIKAEGGVERFNKLLAMAERETKALTACARALRLTPASVMHPRSAGRRLDNAPADGPRPWDHTGSRRQDR